MAYADTKEAERCTPPPGPKCTNSYYNGQRWGNFFPRIQQMVADNNTTYHKSLKRKNIHHVRIGAIITPICR